MVQRVGARSGVCVVVAMLALVACGGDGSSDSAATLPLAEPGAAPDHTGPTDDLAPSQITGSTVAAPDTPGPCALADLEFWTARVFVGEQSADAVIRVRNTGDVWCEPDISNSAFLDEAVEPDVWLDPGGWADLVVGQSGRECFAPEIVTLAEIDVDGESVVVPTAAVTTCSWELTAYYPNDLAVDPCSDLDTAGTERFVLVRNAGFMSCVLGELTSVEGMAASTIPRIVTSALSLVDLGVGDVVAIPFTVDPAVVCDSTAGAGGLIFEVAGPMTVDAMTCGAIFELGAARPWYGDPNGPLAVFAPDAFDLDEVLTALDPFA